jgi:sigma-E factor negative regulatory protein RseB
MRARSLRAVAARLGRAPYRVRTGLVVATLCIAPGAFGQDATQWMERAATAARKLNYVGTIAYQHGGQVETSRLMHLADGGVEYEKLTNLDGPAREVVRVDDQVRCYYSDAKLVRVEPRALHNVFPSLLPQQLATLADYYTVRKAETARIAGMETQAYVFEPRDGMRYGHKFWADVDSGLLLKARLINEKGEPVEQFAFTDVQIGAKLTREMFSPPFTSPPPDWQVRESLSGEVAAQDTGWVVKDLPPGFAKVTEGYRKLRGKHGKVAHLVFSDGLVAVSVFIEAMPPNPQALGLSQQDGISVYSRQLNDSFVTVLGEAPGATVRQIAYSVSRR